MVDHLRSKTTHIRGIGDITVNEMNGRCYVATQRARRDDATDIELAAIVASHCAFPEKSPDELLEKFTPVQLAAIMGAVASISGDDNAKKKSATTRKNASSSD